MKPEGAAPHRQRLAFVGRDDIILPLLLSYAFPTFAGDDVPPQTKSFTPEQLHAYSTVFDDLTDPVIIEDMAGNVLDMNPEAERVYGWAREELLGKPIKALVPPERHEQAETLLRRCRQREMVRNIETIRKTKSGEQQIVLLTLSLLTDELNEPVGIASIAKDITELKHANARLRRAERQARRSARRLERNNEKLTEFTRICSHDLRAPLRRITTLCELIEADYSAKLDETAGEYIRVLVEQTSQMQELINDLLDYARSDTEQLKLEQVDTRQIVDQTLANLEADIGQKEAVVTFDSLPVVEGDSTLLQQLFQNLIENAIKYCSDRRPEIHVSAECLEDEWLFSVRDNGIGIESGELKAIFQPFRRLHSDDQPQGTGVGLAICRRAVERHEGRIWAESVAGKGSVFHFTIPLPDRDE